MKSLSFVLVLLFLQCIATTTAIPGLLDDEKYDEDPYEEMLSDDDIFISRRRDDPVMDEEYWKDNDDFVDGNDFNLKSNMDGDVQSIMEYNGIDLSKLPPNYHNTSIIKKKVGNKTITTKITINKATDPKTGAVSISVIQSSNGGSGISVEECSSAKPCKKEMFCRKLLYGNYCSKCSNIKEPCGSNEQCCGNGTTGSLCVRGTCQTGFVKGQAGTLCQLQNDCNAGLCCARKFMKKNGECMTLGKKGDKCEASSTELSLIMHGGLCPCQSGLVCSSGSWLEGFFGGSMNTVLGGNTCRLPRKRKNHNFWPFGFDDEDEDKDFEDILE